MSNAARTTLATLVGEDVIAALTMLDADPIDAVCITGLPAEQTDRATFRIRLADGRVVKARRFRRAAKAERFARIVRTLSHERLRPPLLVADRVSIEAWVDGTPVSALPRSTERLLQAADLLGSIHAPRTPFSGPSPSRSTSALLASTRRRIADLGGRGVLTRAEVSVLLHVMQRLAPSAAEVGVTHNDFCAENLVEDARGSLVVVDNEGIRRGFLDYDLARTWYRWPMAEDDWHAFAARYQSWRPESANADAVVFWRIAAVVKSAHLRAARRTADAALPIDRLRVLLDAL